MIREAVALTALRLAGALYRASEAVAKCIGARAGDHVEFVACAWSVSPREEPSSWAADWQVWVERDAVRTDRDNEHDGVDFKYRGFSAHRLRRFGNVVIVCDFAPDGGGTTYVLDARMERK